MLPAHIQTVLSASIASGMTDVMSHDALWYGNPADRADKIVLWTSPQGNLAVSSFDAAGNWKPTVINGVSFSDTLSRSDDQHNQLIKDGFAASVAPAPAPAPIVEEPIDGPSDEMPVAFQHTMTSVKEFADGLTGYHAAEFASVVDPGFSATFDVADANQDGVLSAAEAAVLGVAAGTTFYNWAEIKIEDMIGKHGLGGGAIEAQLAAGNADVLNFLGFTAREGQVLAAGGSVEQGGSEFSAAEIAQILTALDGAASLDFMRAAGSSVGTELSQDQLDLAVTVGLIPTATMEAYADHRVELLGAAQVESFLGDDSYIGEMFRDAVQVAIPHLNSTEITLIGQGLTVISLDVGFGG